MLEAPGVRVSRFATDLGSGANPLGRRRNRGLGGEL